MPFSGPYSQATRHPLPGLLFMLPLLLLYEGGVLWLGGPYADSLRNGADHWVRCALRAIGLPWFWVAPTLLVLIYCGWVIWRWKDRPGDLVNVLSGMFLECVVFALGLWAISRVLGPAMNQFGIPLAITVDLETSLQMIMPYLGAGIYEEALFRLALYSSIAWVLYRFNLARALTIFLAALGSATLFSAAHHVGPYGQAYGNYLFLFRLLAGFYFALIFEVRGFGIAVGTHSCYNVMVSVPMN